MMIEYLDRTYETQYYPFFRIEKHEDFDVYTMTYPSGRIEEILIFDVDIPSQELQKHLVFLLREYALEEDDKLSPEALELKKDVRQLFAID